MMECREVKKRLADLLAGTPGGEGVGAVEQHLAQCPDCRAELAALRAGEQALAQSVGLLAPTGRYLTRRRLRRLRAAARPSGDRPKILTLQRLVGSAAAAATLVSCIFIYQRLTPAPVIQDARGVQFGAQYESRPGPVMIGLVSAPRAPRVDLVQVVSGYMGYGGPVGTTLSETSSRRSDVMFANSPGMRVPVSNRLYDAEEGAYWW